MPVGIKQVVAVLSLSYFAAKQIYLDILADDPVNVWNRNAFRTDLLQPEACFADQPDIIHRILAYLFHQVGREFGQQVFAA